MESFNLKILFLLIMIDVKKLKKDEEDRNKLKTKGFIKILGLINNKILLIAKTKQKSTWFEIPLFILGFPTYELKESSDFLINDTFFSSFFIGPI